MPDRLITVATYNVSFEAEAAKNLLEAEGIRAFVSGGLTGSLLSTFWIHLQVQEEDAPRASAILAEVEASRDPDWEEGAEKGAGVWTCSLCGEPVADEVEVCPSCQTLREAIHTPAMEVQREPPPPPLRPDAVQVRDQVTTTASPPPAPQPSLETAMDEGPREPKSPYADGDDLARRALIDSVCSLVGLSGVCILDGPIPLLLLAICYVLLVALSWWYLFHLFSFTEALSPRGLRYIYVALALNGIAFFFWVLIGLRIFRRL
jgi:hypothetical protein